MKTTVLARIAAVAIAAVALAACSAINPITSQNKYQASDGVTVPIGDTARGINLLVVTAGVGEPAVLTGSIRNDAAAQLDLTVSIDGSTTSQVTVPGQSTVQLGTKDGQSLVIGTAPVAPGLIAQVWFTTMDTGAFQAPVPVVDGTLDPYQDIVDSIPAAPSPSAAS